MIYTKVMWSVFPFPFSLQLSPVPNSLPSWNGFIKQVKFEEGSERVEIVLMANG